MSVSKGGPSRGNWKSVDPLAKGRNVKC
jgi:hypothetical protein